MCGLVGIVSNTSLGKHHLSAFGDMLYMDALRGWHSTGVAKICNTKHEVSVHKRAVSAMSYMDKDYDKFLLSGASPQLLIGHNRAATQGEINDANAHPFTHGDITLVHNGTLWHHNTICPGSSKFDVDSEAICYALSTAGVTATLEKLDGAFALVWFDNSDKTLNFARNSERPLWLARSEFGTTLAWASDKYMLLCAIHRRNSTNVKYTVEKLPELKHYKFPLDLKKDTQPEIEGFKEVARSYNYKNLDNYDNFTQKYLPRNKSSVNTDIANVKKCFPSGKHIEFVVTRITKQVGRPTYGQIEGHIRGGTQLVGANSIRLQGVEIKDWFKGTVSYTSSKWDYGIKNSVTQVHLVEVKRMTDAEIQTVLTITKEGYVKGPNSIYISQARFLELTSGGCSMCGETIYTTQADRVKWFDVDVPLCPSCAESIDCG